MYVFLFASNYLSGVVGSLRYNFSQKQPIFNLSYQEHFQFYSFLQAWWQDGIPPQYHSFIIKDSFINYSIACGIVLFLGFVLWLLWQSFFAANRVDKKNIHGNAKFAGLNEIKQAGLLALNNAKNNTTNTKQSLPSIILGKFGNYYLQFNQAKFVSLAAPTRSGKGVGVVIPNLLHWQSSIVCLDIKGENFDKTSGYRAQFSKVFKFDPFSENTHSYSPLTYISRREVDTISDIQTIARILWPINDTDPIWNDSSCNLFQGLVLFLLDQEKNTTSVNTSINTTMFAVVKLAGDIGAFSMQAWQHFMQSQPDITLSTRTLTALNSYFNLPQETRTSVLGTFNAQMQMFTNPTVIATTSKDDFNLKDIRKQKMSIYVCIAPNRLSQASKLLNIFFSQLIQLNTDELPEQNAQLKETVLILLDEFTALGKVNIIEKAISYIAGYNLRLLLIYQSQSQLSAVYGEESARNIVTNCGCQILFAPREQSDAEEYSKILGNITMNVQNYSYNHGGNTQSSSGKNISINQQERALMLPQELKQMGNDKSIIIMEDCKPIKAQKIKYYEDVNFTKKLIGKIVVKDVEMREEWLGISKPIIVQHYHDNTDLINKLSKQAAELDI